MCMSPVARDKRGGIAHTCVRQARKLCDAHEFLFRIFEECVVVRDESLARVRRFDQSPIINFPKPQTKSVGSSIPFPHRVGDLERVAHNDQCFERRKDGFPKWPRQTVARIFPAPDLHFNQTDEQASAPSPAKDRDRLLAKLSVDLGGKSHAPPNELRISSFSLTKRRCSQKPSGLSACAGIKSDSAPR